MSKWYEVKVTTIKTFAVEVPDHEDHEDAIRLALEEAGMFEGDVTAECDDNEPATPEQVERLQNHADEVICL